jgi:hypothetical protein
MHAYPERVGNYWKENFRKGAVVPLEWFQFTLALQPVGYLGSCPTFCCSAGNRARMHDVDVHVADILACYRYHPSCLKLTDEQVLAIDKGEYWVGPGGDSKRERSSPSATSSHVSCNRQFKLENSVLHVSMRVGVT